MKKIFAMLLVCIITVSLTACDQPLLISDEDILDAAKEILDEQGKIIVDIDEFEEMELALLEPKSTQAPTPTPKPTPDSTPIETPKPTPKPAVVICLLPSDTDPSLLLVKDEYGIYENGEAVTHILGMDSTYPFFRFDRNYEPGRVFETKRGIKVGSTVEELATAYKGITATIDSLYVFEDADLDEYLKEDHPEFYEDEDYSVFYQTGYVKDNLYSGPEIYTLFVDVGIDYDDYLDDPRKIENDYDISLLNLHFDIQDKIVTSIYILK